MKRYNALILWVALTGLIIIGIFSVYSYSRGNADHNKEYRIEINRISKQVSQGILPKDIVLDQATYTYVRSLSWMGKEAASSELELFFNGAGVKSGNEFTVRPIYQGQTLTGYLRFSYETVSDIAPVIITMDLILLLALALVIGLLMYVKLLIIKPFHTIEELPFELSRGHLHPGMKESKSRFFGKFIWGLNLLRETLDTQKQTNLRLEKERQTLVASLSHELKTPVAAIKLYSSAIYGDLYDSEDKRKACAKMIGQKAEQIELLINDIITTSVSSLQDIEIHNVEFYLGDWIRGVVHNHKEHLDLLKISLKIGAYEDKLLTGDPDKLLEVMDNIIGNAIKYGDGGPIEISFLEEDYRQLIRVENTGTPVSPGELPYIFTSFWRGSNAATKEGNGLGLYICKQQLLKMGGDVYAEATGQGMRFTIVVRY